MRSVLILTLFSAHHINPLLAPPVPIGEVVLASAPNGGRQWLNPNAADGVSR